jgi:ribose transport system ATP-binding protein
MTEVLFRLEGITKTFPGVQALSDCHFELHSGEVHALVGENGAGKSTLMKVVSGIYQRDSGQIFYKGSEVEIPTPRAAQELFRLSLLPLSTN